MLIHIHEQFDDEKRPTAEDVIIEFRNTIEKPTLFSMRFIHQQSIPNGDVFVDWKTEQIFCNEKVAECIRYLKKIDSDIEYCSEISLCGIDISFHETFIEYPWNDC